MGGSDRGDDRDIRRIVPGGILDGVERRNNVEKWEVMAEEDFEEWYDWLKTRLEVEEVEDIRRRMACIEGFFKGLDGRAYTAEQVIKILALRYPEEKE